MVERTAGPHRFWLVTCGVDTHRRSANYARLDTPWNAFTQERDALVCTLWVDSIVDIFDPDVGRIRRFVKLGGKSKEWRGVAIAHGQEARSNLEDAVALRKPIFGFEAEPNLAALGNGVRAVKHFYLDRVHQLKGWIGLSKMDLEERLQIESAFRARDIHEDIDSNSPATLFELVDATAAIPGALKASPAHNDADEEENESDDEAAKGNLSSDEYARLALPILIAHVLQQVDGVLVPITYLDLAQMLGRKNKHGAFWARGLGKVLGRVTRIIESVASQYPERPPYLTSIVVLSSGSDAGLPDKGVSGHWPGYEALSHGDKQAKVGAEYQRILSFGNRWNEILRLAGLPPVPPPLPAKSSSAGGWSGGESQAHKDLKRYVFEHPELCGAGADWFAQEEYALRSGDELDVMFMSDRLWIGIEVKSRTSDQFPRDYERGIYQVVKYKAVLDAQARIDHAPAPPEVRVLLVLETRLPDSYLELARTLGVGCIEELSSVVNSADRQA